MDQQDKTLSLLLHKVEEMVGRTMRTPKDFEFLAAQIYEQTHSTISVSTLKRVWGYVDAYKSVRESTLDLLAQFIGYDNYQHFCLQTQSQQAVFTPQVKNIYIVALFSVLSLLSLSVSPFSLPSRRGEHPPTAAPS